MYGTQEATPKHSRAYPSGYHAPPQRRFALWDLMDFLYSGKESRTFERRRMAGLIRNPAQDLLNMYFTASADGILNIEADKRGEYFRRKRIQRSKDDLRRIGVQLYWIAVEMSDEEVAAALNNFPHRCKYF